MRRLCRLAAVISACLIASGISCAEMGGWIRLFNGKDLEMWRLRNLDGRQSWSAVAGVLHNVTTRDAGGTDICTVEKFGDCQLHIEFRVPKDGNSGVYLQGRYEVQVADSYEQGKSAGMCGAIYGQAVPKVNASKPPGEWQSYDILFRQARLNEKGEVVKKARISVLHNGKMIIDDVEMNGVTGGALDNKEGTPGPLMLQGDHSSVDYQNILLRPLDPQAAIAEPLPPPDVLLKPLPLPPGMNPVQPKAIEPLPAKR
jgi:hypothetical protein